MLSQKTSPDTQENKCQEEVEVVAFASTSYVFCFSLVQGVGVFAGKLAQRQDSWQVLSLCPHKLNSGTSPTMCQWQVAPEIAKSF